MHCIIVDPYATENEAVPSQNEAFRRAAKIVTTSRPRIDDRPFINTLQPRKLRSHWTEAHQIFTQCRPTGIIAAVMHRHCTILIRFGMPVRRMRMGSANFANLVTKLVAISTSLERSQNGWTLMKPFHYQFWTFGEDQSSSFWNVACWLSRWYYPTC